jgi:hypothetical protein
MLILGIVPCFLYVFSYVLQHWYEPQCNRTFSNDLSELLICPPYRLPPRLPPRLPLDPPAVSRPNATPPLPLLTDRIAFRMLSTASPPFSFLARLVSPSNFDKRVREVCFSCSADASAGSN